MLALPPFHVARLPEIHFGNGTLGLLPNNVARFGTRALLVQGRSSFQRTEHWPELQAALIRLDIEWRETRVADEPSPQLVDDAVAEHLGWQPEVVVGIGGGSVLDAAKAIAGLLITGDSVMAHLEGVGEGIPYQGPAVPFIAVPTTAGTGSEATKNSVLSVRGDGGFKKSFRDEQLVPRLAIVDPDLLAGCPRGLVAANGMDAFTQLLESYVSLNASPFTDALAASGMQRFRDAFWSVWESDHADAETGRSGLAYASLCSGITLAQAGLGSVHGLASPLGAFFPIPHGVVCGTLVAEATQINIQTLREREPDHVALGKYAEAAVLLSGRMYQSETQAQDALVKLLREWTERLDLPRLSRYGMTEDDVPRVVANSRGGSMKTNPILLSDPEVAAIVRARL